MSIETRMRSCWNLSIDDAIFAAEKEVEEGGELQDARKR